MRSLVIAFVLFFALCATSHAARMDTTLVFSTIETANFSIHFHQGMEAVARKTALIAEEVHDRLGAELGWFPSEKTQLVLIDNSDFSNGFATALPYNTIIVQPAPPSLASGSGEYDDWLKTLITHEYAHIVTLDPARGYWKLTRSIFGKPVPGADIATELFFIVTAPANSFLPRWWHEGMATWAETEFTAEGRGRGTFFDMIYRMAAVRGELPPVDRANGDVPFWPSGDLPYIYGYRLQKYLADTYGKQALRRLNLAHAGRFPYLINRPPEELFKGKSYRELYDDMLAALKREQESKLAILSRAPFTPVDPVSTDGEYLGNPRFSPDGSRIAYTRRDPHEHTSTVVTDRDGKKVLARFRRQLSDGHLCWDPDGTRLYYTEAGIVRGFDVYQDLYVYDLEKGSSSRLTNGKRLGEVELSPDGKQFAAVATGRGSQNLVLLERRGPHKAGETRTVTGYSGERVSAPHWSPDSSAVVYAVRDNAGRSSLHLYELAGGTDRTIISVPFTVDQPVWSRDGSFVVYLSDETGVFNLFAYDLRKGTSHQLSHLLGGALWPDLAPDGRTVIFSSYDARGFSIGRIRLDREKWSAARGPSIAPLPSPASAASPGAVAGNGAAGTGIPGAAAGAGTASAAAPAPAAPLAATVPLAVEPYRALGTLLPHFWLPRISADGSSSAVWGAYTAGSDVLGYHSFALSADYSPGRNRGYFDLIYRNDSLYPTFSLLAHSSPFLYANLLQRGDYWELNQGFTLEASWPVNFLEKSFQVTGGYQFQDQSALSRLAPNGRFNGVRVFQGRRDNLFAQISFENSLKYPYSISPEEGRTVTLTYRRFDRAIGAAQDYAEYAARYQEFLGLPSEPLRHHVVYLRLSGAISDGDLKFGQQAFQIGGVPSDLNPYPVRGYPDRSVTGKYVATGTLEYRAPLFYPLRGWGTLPAFAEKLHGALFVDAGEVWDDRNSFSGDKVLVGAGVEARLDVTLGYWLKIAPALGFAHGFSRGGENQVYLTVYLNM